MTYGILKVICAIRIVENPMFIRNAINNSIIDTPVTMSAFSIGMLVTPNIKVRNLRFILWIPMEAKVPITVAISAERSAMIRVLYKVLMIASSWKRDTYHFPVNPPHLARVLELLKDRTISVMIGA